MAEARQQVTGAMRAYGYIAAMWIRSTIAYRTTFVMITVGQCLSSGLDFVAIWIMFGHTSALGGFALPEVALLYGVTTLGIGVADLLVGGIEQIGQRIRDGSLDSMLVRPVLPYAQAAADRFGLHRLGRLCQGSIVFCWALATVDVDWTPGRVLMMPIAVVCGAVIFVSIFTLGAAFQFVAKDAAEVASAFTYGGTTMTQYPPTIFAKEIVRGATFVIPLAFVNWMPMLYVLDRPDPTGLPYLFRFGSPVAAVALAVVTAIAWTTAVRSYRSTGS